MKCLQVASGLGPDLVVEADLGLYDYCALVPVVEVRRPPARVKFSEAKQEHRLSSALMALITSDCTNGPEHLA